MAIYTRMGGKVQKVLGGNVEKDEIDVIRECGKIGQYYIHDMKADGGLQEIQEAIEAENRQKWIEPLDEERTMFSIDEHGC